MKNVYVFFFFYCPTLPANDLKYSHHVPRILVNFGEQQNSKFQICQPTMKYTFLQAAFLVYETHTSEDKSSVQIFYLPRPNCGTL